MWRAGRGRCATGRTRKAPGSPVARRLRKRCHHPGAAFLRGQSHPVIITLTARQDGDTLQAAGTIPVAFSDWAIPSPTGYGPFGSLADHGTAESLLLLLLLVLHRQ